jgi:aldehyde:ferredoxin oxidoreductase
MLNEPIRILYINLTTKKIRISKREDLKKYLGGVGIGSKLLEENMREDLSPLSPEQPIILAIGAIPAIFPLTTKTVAMFISPVTGELGESYAGGRLAYTIFNAGFDAVVITGKADRHCYIAISNSKVEIKDARAFWGIGADMSGQYIRTLEGGSGKRSIIKIGPAGENQCRIANINVDDYRHFGRMGLGAVFGSKNLKAIQVTGDKSRNIPNLKDYFAAYNEIYKKSTSTALMSKYHDLGTPINVKVLDKIGALPTYNLKKTTFANADYISGETFAEKNLIRKTACVGCPVGCIHIGQFRNEFGEGHDYEVFSVAYDYELIATLGSYIGIGSSDEILELIHIVEDLGFDAVASGICLAWATEALEKGLVTEKETIVPLKFGDKKPYLAALKYMAERKNDFYSALSDGIAVVTKKYGGEDFGIAIAKNEVPAYHTGPCAVVGYACGARHSHLCNGGYSLDQTMKEFDADKAVDILHDEELKRCILNSLIICLFARNVYDRDTMFLALKAAGFEPSDEEMTAISKRIYASKLRIKERLGFKLLDVKIPKRIFDTEAMGKKIDPKIVDYMIKKFDNKNIELMEEIGNESL